MSAVLQIDPTMKMCSVCGRLQPITDFHRRRHYSKDGHRAACKDCTAKKSREARQDRAPKRTTDEDRLKAQVRARTRKFILSGELIPRPCRVCGGLEVQAHHPEYEHPDAHLRVEWLCVLHHAQEHGVRGWTKQMEMFPEPPTEGGSAVTYRAAPVSVRPEE